MDLAKTDNVIVFYASGLPYKIILSRFILDSHDFPVYFGSSDTSGHSALLKPRSFCCSTILTKDLPEDYTLKEKFRLKL